MLFYWHSRSTTPQSNPRKMPTFQLLLIQVTLPALRLNAPHWWDVDPCRLLGSERLFIVRLKWLGHWGIGFTRQSTWLISRSEMLFVRSHNTTFWSRRSSILIRFEWSSQLRPKIKALSCSVLDSRKETTSNSWNTTTEWYRILPNIV